MAVSGPPKVVSQTERKELQVLFDRCVRAAALPPYDAVKVDAMLRHCVARDPGNHIYAQAYVQNLDEVARQVRRKKPSWLRRRSIRSALGHNQWAKAFDIGLVSVSQCPGDDESLRAVGLALWNMELEESALCFLRQAARAEPTSDESIRSLADVLLRTGRFDEASAAWRQLATDEAARIRELLRPGQPSSAQLERITAWKESRSERSDAHELLELAEELAREDALDAAAEMAQLALTISPGHQETYRLLEDIRILQSRAQMELALTLSEQNLVGEALVERFRDNLIRVEMEVLGNRHQKHPKDASIALELALRLKAVGNFAEALVPLEQCLQTPQTAPAALLELGECSQHLFRFEEARDWYSRLLATADGDPELHQRAGYRLAVLDLAEGRLDAAEKAFRRLPENYRQTSDHLDKIKQIRDKGEFPTAGG